MLPESDYQQLLRTLLQVTEANKGTKTDDNPCFFDAEGLAIKFFFHASSALFLYRSTSLPDFKVRFIDSGSINVICRAALETFLVFHHLFVEPRSDEDRDCRYMAWVLGGYLVREPPSLRMTKPGA